MATDDDQARLKAVTDELFELKRWHPIDEKRRAMLKEQQQELREEATRNEKRGVVDRDVGNS